MKQWIISSVGVVGSFIASLFGGWTEALTTLLFFMAIDYITGVVLACIFHKSPKTETGAYESKTGLKGLFRKGMILLIVIVAHRVDLILGASYVVDGVCIAFIVNELVSIIENAGLMGVPIPKVITKAIDVLKSKTQEGESNEQSN